jgi:hypothetical protein
LGLWGTTHFTTTATPRTTKNSNDNETNAMMRLGPGKHDTLQKFISRTLQRNNWSVYKMTISQSIPVDWRIKSKQNCAQICQRFLKEDVDIVVNADETFLHFHPFVENLIAPTGVKHVETAMQVDNEKFGMTVMIACEYRTSSILPPMIIFTGVHCAKLMSEWSSYPKGMFIVLLMNIIFPNPTTLSLFFS